MADSGALDESLRGCVLQAGEVEEAGVAADLVSIPGWPMVMRSCMHQPSLHVCTSHLCSLVVSSLHTGCSHADSYFAIAFALRASQLHCGTCPVSALLHWLRSHAGANMHRHTQHAPGKLYSWNVCDAGYQVCLSAKAMSRLTCHVVSACRLLKQKQQKGSARHGERPMGLP